MTKLCRNCRLEKSLDQFNANKGHADGLESNCQMCGKERSRRWYAANKTLNRNRGRAWRKANPDAHRAWDKANPEKARGYKRRYAHSHLELRKTYAHARRARKLAAGGSFTLKEWRDLKAKYGYRCLGCGRVEPEVKLSPDHIVPIKKFGRGDIGNIQPLCFEINGSRQNACQYKKGAKIIDFRPGDK